MKFTTNLRELREEMSIISQAVNDKQMNPNPILKNVKLTAGAETLTLFATDLEASVRVRIPASVERAGETTTDAKALLSLLRVNDCEQVSFETDGPRLTIDMGQSRYVVETRDADDFPIEPESESPKATAQVDPGALVNALSLCGAAMQREEDKRFSLKGCVFVFDKKECEMYSTDGNRLAIAGLGAKSDASAQALIVTRSVKMVQHAVSNGGEVPVTVALSENHLLFRIAHREIYIRLADAGAFSYRKVVEMHANDSARFSVKAGELEAAIRRVYVLVDQSTITSRTLRMAFSKGVVTISSQGKTATASATISYDGEEIVRGYQGRFLTEFLATVDDDAILDVGLADAGTADRGAIYFSAPDPEGRELMYLTMSTFLE